MDEHEYYQQVFDKLERGFDHVDWVLASGLGLIARGHDPHKLLVTVKPVDQLRDLSVVGGFEVFLPTIGRNGSVMAPIDFEIFLQEENYKLYSDPGSQWHYHERHIKPVADFFEAFMQAHRLPYVMDLTPSGGHILFHVEPGTPEYSAFASIGWLEQELVKASTFVDPTDLKRCPPPGFEAASVFSGVGRLWHYISLLTKEQFPDHSLPVTICDSKDKCVNIDNSWQADPAYMRIMRAPFSLHSKNVEKHHMGEKPLVDVMKTVYDGESLITDPDLSELVHTMWDYDRAVAHASPFDGAIPSTNDNIVALIDQYKGTRLCELIEKVDATPELNPGEGLHRAWRDTRLNEKTRSVLEHPNPRLLRPSDLKRFVRDLLIHGNWDIKHIGCLINDMYRDPKHFSPSMWTKYMSRTRANYWARTYATVALMEEGEPLLKPRQ